MDTNLKFHKGLIMSFRRLSRIVEELSFRVEQGTPIIIEGKKDEEAIKKLVLGVFENQKFPNTSKEHDINFNIIKVSGSGLKLFEVAEMAVESSSEVIILTDFDKKGNILAKKLSEDIQGLGSHPDLNIRKNIMKITRKYIKDIESLPKHLKRLELEINPYGNYL
jgi:5S rRNA maturation endonuclease (ribonuclease M5)